MTEKQPAVRELTPAEGWGLLREQAYGRLAYHADGVTRIVPINYVTSGRRIIFRTAEGSKFAAAVTGIQVAFEIDVVTDEWGWSVVASGHVHELTDETDRELAAQSLQTWAPGDKPHVVAIEVEEVTGREIRLSR